MIHDYNTGIRKLISPLLQKYTLITIFELLRYSLLVFMISVTITVQLIIMATPNFNAVVNFAKIRKPQPSKKCTCMFNASQTLCFCLWLCIL